MKTSKKSVIVATVVLVLLSSCKLVDYTMMSTKNYELGIDKSKGIPTRGWSFYVFSVGINLKDATDKALRNAGQTYDLLVDGRAKFYPFFFGSIIKVKGLAISSSELKTSMGEKGFEEWIREQHVFDPETEVVDAEP
ncbi:MAG: hypothetical protein AAGI25_06505 [Bacteroidota bacterium]